MRRAAQHLIRGRFVLGFVATSRITVRIRAGRCSTSDMCRSAQVRARAKVRAKAGARARAGAGARVCWAAQYVGHVP